MMKSHQSPLSRVFATKHLRLAILIAAGAVLVGACQMDPQGTATDPEVAPRAFTNVDLADPPSPTSGVYLNDRVDQVVGGPDDPSVRVDLPQDVLTSRPSPSEHTVRADVGEYIASVVREQFPQISLTRSEDEELGWAHWQVQHGHGTIEGADIVFMRLLSVSYLDFMSQTLGMPAPEER